MLRVGVRRVPKACCLRVAGARVWSETMAQAAPKDGAWTVGPMGSRCKSGAAPATVTGDELGQIHWSAATLWEGPA